ncbi:MAG: tetratricopeptide repeat protein [Chryseolinea sp.]
MSAVFIGMGKHLTAIKSCFLVFGALLCSIGVQAQFSKKVDDRVVQADTLMAREDFAGALALYTKVIESSRLATPQEAHVLYKRAYCYYSLERFDDALTDINRYIEKTDDLQAILLRAYVYQGLGRAEDQLNDINRLAQNNPDNLDLLRWRASVLMDAEKYKDARRDIQKIMMIDHSPDIAGYLGLTYYYDNDPDSAMIIFDKVLATHPEHAQTYVYAASLALEQESFPLALNYINKGLQRDPANNTLMFYKGIALVESEKTDEGCRCLAKAFAAGTDDAGDYLKQYCYGVE